MKPAAFAYHRPASRAETLELLAQIGDDAKVLAGGQSLVPAMNMRLARPAHLVDINRIGGAVIAPDDGAVTIGALVRQAEVERSVVIRERVPLLAHALPFVGHWQTRSRGTLCGSLAHADPSAELPLVATALGATIACVSARGERLVPAADFFVSHFTTALEPDELVDRATFPARRAREGFGFVEFAERHGDYAIVSAACVVRLRDDAEVDELRLVLGGVGERPHAVRCDDVAGSRLDDAAVAAIGERAAAEIDPLGDLRAGADYRRRLAAVLSRRAIVAALDDVRERA